MTDPNANEPTRDHPPDDAATRDVSSTDNTGTYGFAPEPEATAAHLPGPPAASVHGTHSASTLDPQTGLAIGDPTGNGPPARFGDYELIELIARGGMGAVYRARQVSLDRTVALKVILPSRLGSPTALARFRTEAEAAARLDHPSIVRVYEVGVENHIPFLSMAFIEGETLAQRLRRGPLSARIAAELVRQIASAVEHAHRHGVLHRDLKPANILLASSGTNPHGTGSAGATLSPRVTDFGLARLTDAPGGLTASGYFFGTPGYMPPEQADGKTDTGSAADIYGLGAVLYACLTGRPPFQGATLGETLRQVRAGNPVPPSALNRRVPPDLETICLKCLEKYPRDRYMRAALLAADLGRWLNHEPVRARSAGFFRRGWLWCRRNPQPAALTVVVALALAGPVLWDWGERAVAEQRSQEVVERSDATPAEYRAAADYYRQRLADSPDDFDARIGLGAALYRLGEYTEADKVLDARGWTTSDPDAEKSKARLERFEYYRDLCDLRLGKTNEVWKRRMNKGPVTGTAFEPFLPDVPTLVRWATSEERSAPDQPDYVMTAWLFQQKGAAAADAIPELARHLAAPNVSGRSHMRDTALTALRTIQPTPEWQRSETGQQTLQQLCDHLENPRLPGDTADALSQAISRYGVTGQPAIPRLIRLGPRSSAAANALIGLNPDWIFLPEARAAIPDLIRLAASDPQRGDGSLARACQEYLVEIDPDWLTSPEAQTVAPEVRERARSSRPATPAAPQAADGVPRWLNELGGRSLRVRSVAAARLKREPLDRAAILSLIQHANQSQPPERWSWEVLQARRLAGDPIAQVWTEALLNTTHAVRAWPPSDAPLHIEILARVVALSRDDNPAVRWEAVVALNDAGRNNTAATQALLDRLDDTGVPYGGSVTVGAIALQRLPQVIGPDTRFALTPIAEMMLGLRPRPQGVVGDPGYSSMLGTIDRDWGVSPEFRSVLNAAAAKLNDPNPAVRSEMADRLGSLGPLARPAIPALVRLRWDREKNETIRRSETYMDDNVRKEKVIVEERGPADHAKAALRKIDEWWWWKYVLPSWALGVLAVLTLLSGLFYLKRRRDERREQEERAARRRERIAARSAMESTDPGP